MIGDDWPVSEGELRGILALTAHALRAACADGWHDGDTSKAEATMQRYIDASWAQLQAEAVTK